MSQEENINENIAEETNDEHCHGHHGSEEEHGHGKKHQHGKGHGMGHGKGHGHGHCHGKHHEDEE